MTILKQLFQGASFLVKGSLVLLVGAVVLTLGAKWEDVAEQAQRFLF